MVKLSSEVLMGRTHLWGKAVWWLEGIHAEKTAHGGGDGVLEGMHPARAKL